VTGSSGSGVDPIAAVAGEERTPLENVFGWSRSRESTFDECPRRYYYTYYGSWGGWEPEADARRRSLWLLKQVQTRQMWVGDLVHRTCAFALTFARHHGELPPDADAVKHVDHAMREEFRASRDNLMAETGTKHVRLLEHELDEGVPDGEWREMYARAVRAVRAFSRSEAVARALAAGPARWLSIEATDGFDVDDVRVTLRLDFAFDDGRTLTIVDWKTGARAGWSAAEQLAVYALYAHARWHVPLERIRTHETNLVRGEWNERSISAGEIAETRRRILAGATKLKACLQDPVRNVALESAFEKAETLRACGRCAFQRACLGGRAADVLRRKG
jgi:hypothetical protein